jgi:hypothetical protein
MAILFGTMGDGGTVRSFIALAAFASLGAISIGAEAERYAQDHRAAFSLAPEPGSDAQGLPQRRANGIDFGATGGLEREGRRGDCNRVAGRR